MIELLFPGWLAGIMLACAAGPSVVLCAALLFILSMMKKQAS